MFSSSDGGGREFAPAKINLALHVTGRRADGYHTLDSLVAFAAIGDVLHAIPAAVTTLEITGPFAHRLTTGDEENIVLKALQALGRAAPGRIPALRMVLEKHLPVASGIGGGSADAAAALRLALRLSGLELPADELADLALGLGADVPVCLAAPRPARMRGIGEELDLSLRLPLLHAVLVNPGKPAGTAAVFRRLALTTGRAPLPPLPPADIGFAYVAACRNDLEAPAIAEVPEIADVLTALRAGAGLRLARMSGSGATCFGLYEDAPAAARAAAAISRAHPGWWVRRTDIGAPPAGEQDQWAREMQKSTASSSADL